MPDCGSQQHTLSIGIQQTIEVLRQNLVLNQAKISLRKAGDYPLSSQLTHTWRCRDRHLLPLQILGHC